MFSTPAENGDKAGYDKIHAQLASHVIQTLFRGTDNL